VLASAAFTAACGTFAVFFVAGRGGLQMPVAATTLPPVAVASEVPSPVPSAPQASATPPMIGPTAAPSVQPTASPAGPPTAVPTPVASPGRTFAVPTLRPNDPLAALPECPDHPGCYAYVVQRGDTLTGIADRFLVGTLIIEALNPQLSDPSLVVTGQVMYLGLSPFVRLDACADAAPCSLYPVQAGDSVADIAATYLLTVEDIRAANPTMNRPILIGDILRLPHPE
jgi:hypothetical protein